MSHYEIKRVGIAFLGLGIAGTLGWWLRPYFLGIQQIQPVIVNFGTWSIHWYGLLIALAVVLAVILANRVTKNTIWEPHILGIITSAVLGGIIGARLLFVVLKWSYFAPAPLEIFDLPGGGLSIHGALLGGLIASYWYCQANRLPWVKTLDLLVPLVALGQLIGRWGNFFNQEAFGGPTSLPWKMWVAPEFRPYEFRNYTWFHPTFLYESLGLLAIWLILLILQRRQLPAGTVILAYLVAYSGLRFAIEWFRVDSDRWGILTVAQWGSLLIIMGGVIIGLILKRRRKL